VIPSYVRIKIVFLFSFFEKQKPIVKEIFEKLKEFSEISLINDVYVKANEWVCLGEN
jgi:hypothetical protein